MPTKDEIEEMWALFCQDYQENLDTAEDALLKLERDPEQPKLVAGLFRAMHTIKGCAGMMGLEHLQKFAHRGEDLVALVRDKGVKLTQDMTDALLVAVDQLRRLLSEELARHEDAALETVQPITDRISAIIEKSKTDAPAQPASLVKASSAEAAVQPAIAKPEPVPEPIKESPKPQPTPVAKAAPVPPNKEPGYVRIFQEVALAAWQEIASQLEKYAGGETAALKTAQNPLDTMYIASDRMGYVRLREPVERMQAFLKDKTAAKTPDRHLEAWFDALNILATAIHSELMHIQEEAASLGVDRTGEYALPKLKPSVAPPVDKSKPPSAIVPAKKSTAKKAAAPAVATPEPAKEPELVALPPVRVADQAPEATAPLAKDEPTAAEKENTEGLNSIMETAGEIVAGHTTFHQVVSMLADLDPLEATDAMMRQSNNNWEAARPRLEAFFAQWTQALQMLSQTEIKIGGAVGRLQEKARSLGAKAEIMDGMVLRVGDLRYVAPVQAIRRIIMPDDSQLASAAAEGGERLVKLDNEWLPISDLPGAAYRAGDATKQLFVIVEENKQAVALAVEELLGQQQVLVHALPGPWVKNDRVSGCALLGEGEVGVVLKFDE
jgi:chemotaxis protein histidine kinase CheA